MEPGFPPPRLESGERGRVALVFLLLLALAMFYAGGSANESVARAVYFAASAIIIAMAVVVWVSH